MCGESKARWPGAVQRRAEERPARQAPDVDGRSVSGDRLRSRGVGTGTLHGTGAPGTVRYQYPTRGTACPTTEHMEHFELFWVISVFY